MDQELLVDDYLGDGHDLIFELLKDGFDVTAAFWVLTSENSLWSLYISSELAADLRNNDAFRRLYSCLNRLGSPWLTPSTIVLITPTNPISVAAVAARDRRPSRTPKRYRGRPLGPLSVFDTYIYPRERWFKGFEDTKQQFPSARVISLSVRSTDAPAEAALRLRGHVNSSTFEGMSPGTVCCMGPQANGETSFGELLFIYRPEGWNALYKADTNSWEEVVHVRTGERLYPLADFGPLSAMKAVPPPAVRNPAPFNGQTSSAVDSAGPLSPSRALESPVT